MTTSRASVAMLCLAVACILTGCASEGGSAIHFPRPQLQLTSVALPDPSGTADGADAFARVELLAANATDAPLWLKRLTLTLAHDAQPLAAGRWEGDRQLDSGASVLLDIALPMVEGAPDADSGHPLDLTVDAKYARSGLVGLLGGETHTYTLRTTAP